MENKIKIVFFGTPEFAVPTLKALTKGPFDVATVVTAQDQKIGRKQITTHSAVKIFALESDIPIFQPTSLKDDEFFHQFAKLAPDICVVVAYGKIIPERYLAIPKLGFINVHPSLLPKYRGPSPIQSAILNGDQETGVTIMKIDKDIDHGQILASKVKSLKSNIYFSELTKELSETGAELLIETLPKYLSGEIGPKEQDHTRATFTKKFIREDGKIDWDQPAGQIYNQVRALNPEPGTWTLWKKLVLNIAGVTPVGFCPANSSSIGTVVMLKNKLAVKTGECYLEILTIQPEGKSVMNTKAFLNGHPDFIGSILGLGEVSSGALAR